MRHFVTTTTRVRSRNKSGLPGHEEARKVLGLRGERVPAGWAPLTACSRFPTMRGLQTAHLTVSRATQGRPDHSMAKPKASDPRVHRERTPRVCDGPQSQPLTCCGVPVAIFGPYSLATGITAAQSTLLPVKMTTCSAPSGPLTDSHRTPSMAGSRFESGIEVAGGNDGPGTAGAFEFSVVVRDEVGPEPDGEPEPIAALPEIGATDVSPDDVDSSPPQATSVRTAPAAITNGAATRGRAIGMGPP